MRFSDMLKALRKSSGLTQVELAEKLGLTRSSLSMYELGDREPNFKTLKSMADFFNVDTDYLLGGSGKSSAGMRLGEVIHNYRVEKGISMGDFAKLAGVSKAYVSFLEKGINPKTGRDYAPSIKTIRSIAKAMNMDFGELFDMLDGEVSLDANTDESETDNVIAMYPDVQTVDMAPVPLVGDVACGQPIVANREYETYVMADSKIRKKVNFCVRAKGDSMINARIYDGDVVFIKKMPTVDDGDIAAVIIEDSVTLKRVYYDKTANRITLAAENPSYAPLIYQGEELDHIQILGKAIFFQSNIK